MSSNEVMYAVGANGKYANLYPNGKYDPTKYERACNTVDMAICRVRDGNLQVLLIQRGNETCTDEWAIPGGFVDIASMESLDEAAYRELKEETGVENVKVEQLTTMGDANRDPRWRIISTVYYALVSDVIIDKTTVVAGDDAKAYQWVNTDDILDGTMKLAFDHADIIQILLDKLRSDIQHTPLAFTMVPLQFTYPQLQMIYEAILGRELLATNFKRNILSHYIIHETAGLFSTGLRGKKARMCIFGGTRKQF